MSIPFNKPYLTGKETQYISTAQSFCGDGKFTKACHQWLQENFHCEKALLTHSCTASLEMTALLIDIQPGDEIIMPSYTFVSTANAFVLRGGVPVFVDIRPDTLNLNEQLIEAAITSRTKAIVPVHYAGISCEMNTILKIAEKHNLYVIEDAAQGVMSYYHGRALGTIGDLGVYSFHETKNIISGEGGALIINNPKFTSFAEIIREKGTDRSQFLRGQVDKYTWKELGSSYLPSELIAAFLLAQLETAAEITNKRLELWNYYHQLLAGLEQLGYIKRPTVPAECQHNAHLYYILVDDFSRRTELIAYLKQKGISALFHYIPLHSSPAGQKFGRMHGDLGITTSLSERLIRLPLYTGMTTESIDQVVNEIKLFMQKQPTPVQQQQVSAIH